MYSVNIDDKIDKFRQACEKIDKELSEHKSVTSQGFFDFRYYQLKKQRKEIEKKIFLLRSFSDPDHIA